MTTIATISRDAYNNVDIIVKNSYELTPHQQSNVTTFIQQGATYLSKSDAPCTVNLILDDDDVTFTRIQQLESMMELPERYASTLQNKN
jgi:hypothetical protein